MKVIALLGQNSCGKSHSLNILYSLLLNDGYIQVSGNWISLGNKKQEDFLDILVKNDKKVGIFSMGDISTGKDSVGNLLKRLENLNCEVSYCACTIEQERSIQSIESFDNYELINKTVSKDEAYFRYDNFCDAKKMLSYS